VAESLGSAVLTIAADTQPLQAGLNKAKQYADSFGQSVGRAFAGSTGASLTSLNIKLASLQQELQGVTIGTRRFRELREEIDKTQKVLNKANGIGGGSGILGNIATGLAGLGIGAAGLNFFKQSIQSAIEFETITKKLSNTLGDQGAGKALAFTKSLADELGLSFKTLAGTFGSFTAAASAAGVPLDVQRNLFASVSKAAQQLGLSNDELAGSLLALQQIASKGTVSMEELRGQLGERLPIAFAAAAKGLGLTQQELIKLVEGGRLTSTQFFPAITKGLNELTSSSEGAPTAAQNLAKLGNAWDALQTSFGTDLLPSVTESVKTLAAVIEGLGRKQRADKLGFGTGGAGLLGQLSDEAIAAVENLKLVQQQFNLTDQQANALFTDAVASTQRGRLVQSPAFLDAERISLVNQKVRELAQSYRDANPDRADQLSKENALIEKLRAAAVARADAELKIIGPSKQRLADLQAIQGLEGVALEQAKSQLAIDQARAAEKKAIADYDKKLAGAGFDRDNPTVIDAAAKVEAASNNVKTALIEGSAALKSAGKDAADRFISASRQLLDARLKLSETQANPQGLNRFLAPDEVFIRTRAAITSLGPQLEAALKRGAELLRSQGVGTGRPLFGNIREIFSQATAGSFASLDGLQKITQFINDVNAEADAIAGVNSAQDQVNAINKELVGVNTSLRDQITALVGKAWNVQVNVDSSGQSTVYGDVVNTALSPA
jgi:tape measure domain-containing protein